MYYVIKRKKKFVAGILMILSVFAAIVWGLSNDDEISAVHQSDEKLAILDSIGSDLTELPEASRLAAASVMLPVRATPDACALNVTFNEEHSVILTLPVAAVDAAQTLDGMCRYTWRSAAPTSGCCLSHTTRLLSV